MSKPDFRNVSVHFRGDALAELERIADDQDVPYSHAARMLIDRALEAPAAPTVSEAATELELLNVASSDFAILAGGLAIRRSLATAIRDRATATGGGISEVVRDLLLNGLSFATSKAAEPAAPAPLPLAEIALDALLAEVKRRVEAAADDEALGAAVARAEAAEARFAQVRAAIGVEVAA